MPMIDMPATPVSGAEVVIERRVGEAGNRGLSPVSVAIGPRVDESMSVAQVVEQDGGRNSGFSEMAQGRILGPAGAVYLLKSSGWLQRNGITDQEPTVTAILANRPKHGQVVAIEVGEYKGQFRYTPDSGYLGKDSVGFILDIVGKKVLVTITIHVVENIEEPNAWLSNGQVFLIAERSPISVKFTDFVGNEPQA